jgi:glycosidase
MLKKILLICVCASLVLSCKKDPVVPNPPTSEQYGVPFAEVPAPEDAVIYQVNMRVFSQQGNFEGVRARLDSISALGVNVIYLMPIYPVGTVNAFNSPYCVRNYRTVNSEFGTLGQLRELVAAAHARHMAVILDWVANHTAWDHPWTSDHPDWYQQDGSGTIIHPPGTNWNDVAQLNFNNAEMRLEMIQSMRLWVMTANVDGFRCDYADGPPTDFWTQAIDSSRRAHRADISPRASTTSLDSTILAISRRFLAKTSPSRASTTSMPQNM